MLVQNDYASPGLCLRDCGNNDELEDIEEEEDLSDFEEYSLGSSVRFHA